MTCEPTITIASAIGMPLFAFACLSGIALIVWAADRSEK